MVSSLTPYPAINAILALLLREVQEVLGPELVGLYCYGSLSLGDFDPASSDIDFLVATAHALPDETVAALAAIHARIAASGLEFADKLEGSYIPRAALRRYDPANNRHPTIGVDWAFDIGAHDSSWVIERHIIRAHGLVVFGPPPKRSLTRSHPMKYERRCARHSTASRSYNSSNRRNVYRRLRMREYQAFTILTMCRALYTLDRGEIVSKPVAAAWARETLPPSWPDLIATALRWRHDPARTT